MILGVVNMSNVLKLHWASSKPNFGDWLSPEIVAHLSGKKVEHASIDKCDLLAIGSLLQRVKEGFFKRQINVWGSGFIEESKKKKSKHIYHAVRGKKSSSVLTNAQVRSHGDPGLLVGELYKKSTAKTKTLGIVPHYKDQSNRVISQMANDIEGSMLIDVFEEPREVIKKITQCEFIISSSLHGLVVADAYGIPNQWIEVSDGVRGHGWKFDDYYSVMGIDQPIALTLKDSGIGLREIIEKIGDYGRPNLDLVKEGLLRSFPFQKGIES